jgi:hypothetical protein
MSGYKSHDLWINLAARAPDVMWFTTFGDEHA